MGLSAKIAVVLLSSFLFMQHSHPTIYSINIHNIITSILLSVSVQHWTCDLSVQHWTCDREHTWIDLWTAWKPRDGDLGGTCWGRRC